MKALATIALGLMLAIPAKAAESADAQTLESRIEQTRKGALSDYSSYGAEAVPALVKEIERKDNSESVRRSFYYCLGRLRSEAAIPNLTKLLNNKSEHLAESAGGAVSETVAHYPDNHEKAIQALLGSRHEGVRNQGLRLIAEHAWSASYVPAVRKALLHDSNEGNRIAAAIVLAARKVSEAKPDLKKALTDKSEKVRGAAEYSLKQFENEK